MLLALVGAASPPAQSQKTFRTPHVVVYYDTAGSDAVGVSADTDKNGVPDYVDSIGIHAESFWTDVVSGMGAKPPAFDAGIYPAYPIFVKDISSSEMMTEYGYNEVATYPSSLVVVENDFRYNDGFDSAISQQPDGKGGYAMVSLPSHPFTLLKGIVYHELMHGVQRNYVTNEQLGKLWGEKVTTWIENRTLGAQGVASHPMDFTLSVGKDFLRGTTSSARYGQSRFLELLARKAGASAVMEIYTSRKRWVDSLGAGVVDDPASETAFFQAILARHGLDWDRFLGDYSEQLARIFLAHGSLFPADEQFFRAGNTPAYDLVTKLPWNDSLGPLRLKTYLLPMVQLGAGTNVTMRCPTGTCYATLYNFLEDTIWSAKVDPTHPLSLVVPKLNYIRAFVLTGLDSTRTEFVEGATGVLRSNLTAIRATWAPGAIRIQGLEGDRTARLRAWNIRGSLVLDTDIRAGDAGAITRPMGEGPLVTRLELYPALR